MKIAEINTVDYGSTGRIMFQIAECARNLGYQVWTFSIAPKAPKQPLPYHEYYSSYYEYCVHYVLGRLTGRNGRFSICATNRLIHRLQKIKPDVIHIHNLHGFSINIPMLFRYLKKCNIRVIWTLHDCWAFTGHCPHYQFVRCEKWKTGCCECVQYKEYPESQIDNSQKAWNDKKRWFQHVKGLTIVTPSVWLATQVQQSFLKDYNVTVINNGVDLSVFQPTPSNFRQKYQCEKKKIVLGVAFGWGIKKGLDVFIELAVRLSEEYQIVLVGCDEKIEKLLPDKIISIRRTQHQRELAEIYSAADVFVNPTREDTFPTVNIEALACGTPVVTFETGGSPEILDETCGFVVPYGDVDELQRAIHAICNKTGDVREVCVARARHYDRNEKYKEYVMLYEDCSHSTKCTV